MKKIFTEDSKQEQLKKYYAQNTGLGKDMTRDSGVKVENDSWGLKAGQRGPLLLEDFQFYRKQSRLNRERIPEKVVHARGFGLYGEFELYKSMREYTIADFLQEPGTKTPVFTRFSNFVGSKGSKDTAIDIRGFAVKFYTKEGNYDMLSLQFPVFILADAMKFMDVTHAVKPNPKTDVPQASVAHDNFWDYVANNQESAHMVMWLMSLRGRPRSWRMMEGWPINTFRLINKDNVSTYVKFVWKPILGVHSILLDEANEIAGIDPDFHRNDIIEAVKKGAYPEYELGVQLIKEEDKYKYDFDVLDPTKMWPEEIVPVEIIGKLTLNRLVENFFAEDEQSSFDPATVVPGIDFTDDPVLQGRSFAYRDTDYHRLGTANINEIPVNRPIVKVNTNHRDGYSKYRIDIDSVNYHENSLACDTPSTTKDGYTHYPTKVKGHLTRERPSESFFDYFSQARLFYNSLAKYEKEDLIDTFIFHLQQVKSKSVRKQNVEMWANVDYQMASLIADNIGVERPKRINLPQLKNISPTLSMVNTSHYPYTQKLAVLIGNGFNSSEVIRTLSLLQSYGVFIDIVSEKLGTIVGNDGTTLEVDATFKIKIPALYDSFYIVGGCVDEQTKFNEQLKHYFKEAYNHYKPIGIATTGLRFGNCSKDIGVISAFNNSNFNEEFLCAIAKQRFWTRKPLI